MRVLYGVVLSQQLLVSLVTARVLLYCTRTVANAVIVVVIMKGTQVLTGGFTGKRRAIPGLIQYHYCTVLTLPLVSGVLL